MGAGPRVSKISKGAVIRDGSPHQYQGYTADISSTRGPGRGYGIVPHMMRMPLVDPESGGGEPRALDEGGRSR